MGPSVRTLRAWETRCRTTGDPSRYGINKNLGRFCTCRYRSPDGWWVEFQVLSNHTALLFSGTKRSFERPAPTFKRLRLAKWRTTASKPILIARLLRTEISRTGPLISHE